MADELPIFAIAIVSVFIDIAAGYLEYKRVDKVGVSNLDNVVMSVEHWMRLIITSNDGWRAYLDRVVSEVLGEVYEGAKFERILTEPRKGYGLLAFDFVIATFAQSLPEHFSEFIC